MNKLIAATSGAVAIGLGALTVGSLLPAGALQEDDTTEEQTDSAPVGPRHILQDALDELVENGTLTQAQADAVTAEVQERVEALPDRPGRHGHPGMRILRAGLETAAEAIGIEVDALRDALAEDQSIADVAEANGVDPQTVIDAIVAAGNAAIDEAVADERIDEDRAAELRENLPEHAENFVNRTRPAFGDRGDADG